MRKYITACLLSAVALAYGAMVTLGHWPVKTFIDALMLMIAWLVTGAIIAEQVQRVRNW